MGPFSVPVVMGIVAVLLIAGSYIVWARVSKSPKN